MKRIFIQPLFALLLLAAIAPLKLSAQSFKSAVDYNDFIVEHQLAVGNKIVLFNEAMANPELSLDDIKVYYDDLLDQTKIAVAALEKMPAYKGNVKLRDAALALYRFYEKTVANEFKELMEIVTQPEPSEEDLNRANELLEIISSEEATLDNTYLSEQEAFAQQFNFKLSSEVEEE